MYHGGAQKRGNREQEIENLVEKIITQNFLNLVKEIDIKVQEAQRVPNNINTKRSTPRPIIITMPKVKDKERSLKATRERQLVIYKRAPIGCQLISQEKFCRTEGIVKKYSKG